MTDTERQFLLNEVNLLRDVCQKCTQVVKYINRAVDKKNSLLYIITELLEVVEIEMNKQFLLLYLFGLKCIHDNDIIHGDIKPDNVLFTTRGVKFIDFGFSHTKKEIKTYSMIGTAYFMSPEKVMGNMLTFDDAKRNDVRSLGITLYYIFNKKYPWKDADTFMDAYLHARDVHINIFDKIIQPSHTGSDVDDIINKMLIIDPNKRSTIEELLNLTVNDMS